MLRKTKGKEFYDIFTGLFVSNMDYLISLKFFLSHGGKIKK